MAQPSISCLLRSVAGAALGALLLVPRPGLGAEASALDGAETEAAGESCSEEPDAALSKSSSTCEAPRQWYGYQLMIADVASVSFSVVALQNKRLDYAAIGGAASILLTPAIMHAIHGSAWRAVASPLMRIAIPVTVAAMWHAANPCTPGEWFCGLDAVVFGGGLGLGTAMVIDWVWAFKPATPAPESKAVSAGKSHSIKLHAAAVAPVDGGGAKLVLGGSF